MKIIKCLVENIEEEMHDAEKYAKLAYQYREEYPQASNVFLTLSRQEVTHLNMLHDEAARLINEYRSAGNDPPEAMLAVWNWEHAKMIDNLARIKTMQDMAR